MVTLLISLTDYFRLGRYQNDDRYIRFRIQTKEQTLAMSKIAIAKRSKVMNGYVQIFWAEIDLIKYS